MPAPDDANCARCGQPHPDTADCIADATPPSAQIITFQPRPAAPLPPVIPDDPDGPSAA